VDGELIMMSTRRPVLALLAAAPLLVALSPHLARAEDGWVEDANEKGVLVTTHAVPGRGFPIFRGVGAVEAGIFEILAVLDDIARFTEWMADCTGAHIVKQINELERVEYNRIAAPWPVSDRDTTIRSWIEADASKGDVWARFQSISVAEAPAVSGVVRMPRLAGYYHLEVIDAGHTKVTYQVDADPGGLLPDWLVKLTSRKLPIETLVGLRRQVSKTRGQYEAFLKKYDPTKGGKIPAQLGK
jgi:START domain